MGNLSPKSEAIAYRAYIWARDREWDCTIAECAEAIGVGTHSLRNIMLRKGWSDRFRATARDFYCNQEVVGLRVNGTPYKLGLAQLRSLGVEIEPDF